MTIGGESDRGVDLSEAEAFVRRFIEVEHRALRATLEEENDAKALESIAQAHAMLAGDTQLHFGRTMGLSPALRAEDRGLASQYGPRTLFVLRRFPHQEYGEVVQAIVSWDEIVGRRRYFDSFFIARVDGALRVIAKYGLAANGGAVRWKPETGADLGALGSPIETMRFDPPDDSAHRADWERDE